MEKSKTCFQIENISIFVMSIFLFLYSLGNFIFSIFNFVDSEKYKMIVKDGSIYIKHGRKIVDDVDYDYDSIYLNNDIKANFYEK